MGIVSLRDQPFKSEQFERNCSDKMGGTVSREISINEDEGGHSIPRSATLPAGLKGLGEKFNFGTLPRGLGLDSSFTVKLTKSKKLDDTVNKDDLDETNVEIVKRVEPKEDEKKEETIQEFVENMLIKLTDDALANIPNDKLKKSFTLPAGFRGLTKSQSFGKRIRQSIRVLMPARKNVEVVAEENIEEVVAEEKTDEEKEDEETPQTPEPVNETTESVEAESTMDTKKINTTLPISFKGFDLPAKTRQIFKKLVTRTKKPKKESLEVINSILDDIFREVEGEELELKEKKEDMLENEKEEEETELEEKVRDDEKQEETPTGVLDKSND